MIGPCDKVNLDTCLGYQQGRIAVDIFLSICLLPIIMLFILQSL